MPSSQVSAPPPASRVTQPPSQPTTPCDTRSESNGSNAAVALGHIGLFTAERSVNGGAWIPLSGTSRTEADSFHRLIARVCAGEIDPRELIIEGNCSRDIRLIALPG